MIITIREVRLEQVCSTREVRRIVNVRPDRIASCTHEIAGAANYGGRLIDIENVDATLHQERALVFVCLHVVVVLEIQHVAPIDDLARRAPRPILPPDHIRSRDVHSVREVLAYDRQIAQRAVGNDSHRLLPGRAPNLLRVNRQSPRPRFDRKSTICTRNSRNMKTQQQYYCGYKPAPLAKSHHLELLSKPLKIVSRRDV